MDQDCSEKRHTGGEIFLAEFKLSSTGVAAIKRWDPRGRNFTKLEQRYDVFKTATGFGLCCKFNSFGE